jgi:galactonate dehydratase
MAPPIHRVEIVRHPAEPELVHLLVTDADGVTGTGETHGHATAVAALSEDLAAALLGRDATPSAVAAITGLGPYGTRRPSGPVSVESRAGSAFAIAMWDLASRRAGVPLAALTPGAGNASVVPYTTCVEADHEASLNAPAALARSIAADGFGLMKVWPFTPGGDHDRALACVAEAIGHGVDVAVDLVARLAPGEAAAVCDVLDRLGPVFIEDPVADDALPQVRAILPHLESPICAGERFAGSAAYAPLIAAGVDVVHVDVAWCGGPGEALAVAADVAAAGRSLAFHDVSGPVAWATSLQLARGAGVTSYVECARTAMRDRYPAIAGDLPDPARGLPPAGAGHGVALRREYLGDAVIVTVR